VDVIVRNFLVVPVVLEAGTGFPGAAGLAEARREVVGVAGSGGCGASILERFSGRGMTQ